MPVKIFFCYAHEDEPLLNKLKMHLRPLQRMGLIDVWYDRDISAGTDWEQQIKDQLNSAQIILLLVSPDFMNSDYCYSIEMKRALDRDTRREARVIPIILRPVYWRGVLGMLQALPTDAKPVMSSSWQYQDEAFFNVIEGIRTVVEQLGASPIISHSDEMRTEPKMDTVSIISETQDTKLNLVNEVQPINPPSILPFKPTDEKDDLKLIKGIGPATERRLNKVGIYTYAQLASFLPFDIAAAVNDLSISYTRILQEDWIGQAYKIAAMQAAMHKEEKP